MDIEENSGQDHDCADASEASQLAGEYTTSQPPATRTTNPAEQNKETSRKQSILHFNE